MIHYSSCIKNDSGSYWSPAIEQDWIMTAIMKTWIFTKYLFKLCFQFYAIHDPKVSVSTNFSTSVDVNSFAFKADIENGIRQEKNITKGQILSAENGKTWQRRRNWIGSSYEIRLKLLQTNIPVPTKTTDRKVSLNTHTPQKNCRDCTSLFAGIRHFAKTKTRQAEGAFPGGTKVPGNGIPGTMGTTETKILVVEPPCSVVYLPWKVRFPLPGVGHLTSRTGGVGHLKNTAECRECENGIFVVTRAAAMWKCGAILERKILFCNRLKKNVLEKQTGSLEGQCNEYLSLWKMWPSLWQLRLKVVSSCMANAIDGTRGNCLRPVYTCDFWCDFDAILMRFCAQNLPQPTPHGFLIA